VRLRDVEPGDVDAYVRMRCDPMMTAELGGPQPRDGIEAKVARDAREAAQDTTWIKMIVPDEAEPGVVAGSVTLWSHDDDGDPISEIGWMVLPEFQGRGLAKAAVRTLRVNHWVINPTTRRRRLPGRRGWPVGILCW
jgi:RimJ/RimL family protein N-acetyltransferase